MTYRVALMVSLVMTAPVLAQEATDGGVVLVLPKVTRLASGEYLFTPEAFEATNKEFQRLQHVEAQHKAEEPVPAVKAALIGLCVGLAVGAVGTSLYFAVWGPK